MRGCYYWWRSFHVENLAKDKGELENKMLLTILIIITVFCAISAISGFFSNADAAGNWFSFGVLGLIFTGVFGWGFLGTECPDHTKEILLNKNQYELIKHKNYVEWDYSEDLTYKSHDYSDVMNADKMKVYLVIKYNIYGYRVYSIHDKELMVR